MTDSVEDRLARLESRMQRLEESATGGTGTNPATASPTETDRAAGTDQAAGRAWLLDEQRRVYPDTDLVSFVGSARIPGPAGAESGAADEHTVQWQWSRPTDYLLERDFGRAATGLSALAHPVRLALLQAVLDGTDTAAGLARLEGMGTSGQIYHHLNQLAAGGWLAATRRGHWQVPPEKVIPLLTIIMAATD